MKCEKKKKVQSPKSASLLKVPNTEAALPLCSAIDRRWTRCWWDRSSPVTCRRRRPSSLMKASVSGPKTPLVSMATGVNTWEESRLEYFVFFRLSAAAATIPGPRAASSTYEGAKVSEHVASQTSNFPRFHMVPMWFHLGVFHQHGLIYLYPGYTQVLA